MKRGMFSNRITLIAFLAVFSSFVMSLSIVATSADSDDFRWRGKLKFGATLQIKGIRGTIRAEPAANDEVEVVATKRGSGNLNEVKVQALDYAGGLMICSVYPSWDASRSYECLPSSEKSLGGINAEVNGARADIKFPGGSGGEIRMVDVNVDFVIRVPRGVGFVVHSVYGDINARALEGDVIVQSVFGNVHVDIPAAANANIKAKTTLGGISSEFPLRYKSSGHAGQSATGKIGKGQRRVDLNSVMGTIDLRLAR